MATLSPTRVVRYDGVVALSQGTGDEQSCCLCCGFNVFLTEHGRGEGTFLARLQKVGSWDQSTGNEGIGTKSCWAQYPDVLRKSGGLTGRIGNMMGERHGPQMLVSGNRTGISTHWKFKN